MTCCRGWLRLKEATEPPHEQPWNVIELYENLWEGAKAVRDLYNWAKAETTSSEDRRRSRLAN